MTASTMPDHTAESLLLVCPMCHTPTSLTRTALDAGAEWRCGRCARRWDGDRLSSFAAYTQWAITYAATGREPAAPAVQGAPSAAAGGTP